MERGYHMSRETRSTKIISIQPLKRSILTLYVSLEHFFERMSCMWSK